MVAIIYVIRETNLFFIKLKTHIFELSLLLLMLYFNIGILIILFRKARGKIVGIHQICYLSNSILITRSVNHNKSSAEGIVIRHSNGNPIIASAQNVGHASVNVVEAQALRQGLRQALNKDFRKI